MKTDKRSIFYSLTGIKRYRTARAKIYEVLLKSDTPVSRSDLSRSLGFCSNALYGLEYQYKKNGNQIRSKVYNALLDLINDGVIVATERSFKRGTTLDYSLAKKPTIVQTHILVDQKDLSVDQALKSAEGLFNELQEKLVFVARMEAQEEIAALRKELKAKIATIQDLEQKLRELEIKKEQPFLKRFFPSLNNSEN